MQWHTALTANHIYKENLIIDYIQGFKGGPVCKGKTDIYALWDAEKGRLEPTVRVNMLSLTEKHV